MSDQDKDQERKRRRPQRQESLYLRITQVCQRYGDIDRATLWRWRRDGHFPNPVRIGTIEFWSIAALDAWDRELADAANKVA
jgi:prophage regulatory protein